MSSPLCDDFFQQPWSRVMRGHKLMIGSGAGHKIATHGSSSSSWVYASTPLSTNTSRVLSVSPPLTRSHLTTSFRLLLGGYWYMSLSPESGEKPRRDQTILHLRYQRHPHRRLCTAIARDAVVRLGGFENWLECGLDLGADGECWSGLGFEL